LHKHKKLVNPVSAKLEWMEIRSSRFGLQG